jgi:MFS family permease
MTSSVNTATTVVFVVLTPVAGILSDRVGRKPLMITICFAVLTWPLLRLVGNGEVWALALASLVAAVLSASYSGVIVTLIAEQFATRVRTAGVAAPAALGVALFGGTATEQIKRAVQPVQRRTGWTARLHVVSEVGKVPHQPLMQRRAIRLVR